MSYDMWFENEKGEEIQLSKPQNLRGGTYAVGGTRSASFNITYNYSKYYYDKIDSEYGIRFLYDKKPAEIVAILNDAIKSMSGEPSDNYWENSEGNAKLALLNLLALSALVDLEHPNAKLVGD